jgi:hypothetical protein
MNFKWKILEVFANNTVITGCKYSIIGAEDDVSIESEGNYYFNEPSEKVPYAQVTEDMMISWLEQEAMRDGKNHIKLGIEKQLEALKSHKPTPMPWKPQVFKVQL